MLEDLSKIASKNKLIEYLSYHVTEKIILIDFVIEVYHTYFYLLFSRIYMNNGESTDIKLIRVNILQKKMNLNNFWYNDIIISCVNWMVEDANVIKRQKRPLCLVLVKILIPIAFMCSTSIHFTNILQA